jgi:DNA-binding NarL/FixJ family response regulator
VVVSGHQRPTILVEAIEAGAAGFLDKNTAIDDLLGTVRAASAGEILIDPVVLAKLLPQLAAERQAAEEANRRMSRLTNREREVLKLLAAGCRNEAIAGRLFISPPTVRTHTQNILSKLGVHSQLEAVALAARSSQLQG